MLPEGSISRSDHSFWINLIIPLGGCVGGIERLAGGAYVCAFCVRATRELNVRRFVQYINGFQQIHILCPAEDILIIFI